MSTYSYGLPPATTASLKRMIDLGQINASSIVNNPKRNVTSEVQRFITDYLKDPQSFK